MQLLLAWIVPRAHAWFVQSPTTRTPHAALRTAPNHIFTGKTRVRPVPPLGTTLRDHELLVINREEVREQFVELIF
jgi:hypothetical protein